jgi:hypothetical protein
MGNTPSSPRPQPRPVRPAGPTRSPRPATSRSRSSSPTLIVALAALVLLAVVLAGVLLYALPPWLFEREVRNAAYDRYVNLGSAEPIREIVSQNHAAIFSKCFPEGARRTENHFEPGIYNRLMDAKINQALVERRARPQAQAIETTVDTAMEASIPSPPSGPVTPLRIVSMTISRAPEAQATALPEVLLRVVLEVEGLPEDAFRQRPEALNLEASCPSGGQTTLSPLAEGRADRVGSVARHTFRVAVPSASVGEGAGVCRIVATVTGESGNSQSVTQFVALR